MAKTVFRSPFERGSEVPGGEGRGTGDGEPGLGSMGRPASPSPFKRGAVEAVERISQDGYAALECIWDAKWGSSMCGEGTRRDAGAPEASASTSSVPHARSERKSGLLEIVWTSARKWLGDGIEDAGTTDDDSEDGTCEEEADLDEAYYSLEWLTEAKPSLQSLPGFHSNKKSLVYDICSSDALSSGWALQSQPLAETAGQVTPNTNSEEGSQLDAETSSLACGKEADTARGGASDDDLVPTTGLIYAAASPPTGFAAAEPPIDKTVSSMSFADAVVGAARGGGGRDVMQGSQIQQLVTRISSQRYHDGDGEIRRSASEYEVVRRFWDRAWHGGQSAEAQGNNLPSAGFRKVRTVVKSIVRLGITKLFSRVASDESMEYESEGPFMPAPLHSVHSAPALE